MQVTLWGGGTVANGHVLGYSDGRRFTVAGLRVSYPIVRVRSSRLRYKAELIPLAFLSEPRVYGPDSRAFAGETERRSVYGGGGNPVGFEWDFREGRKLRPFADTTFGFLYFRDRVFSPLASQFNFDVDVGGGVKLQRFMAGYRYLHISNANLTERNPGGDFQMLYVGLRLR